MIPRLLMPMLVALVCTSCNDKPLIEIGDVHTTGPTRGPDGEIFANVITFHYEAKDPEPVHLLVGEERIKTVIITGEVNWRIKVDDRKLKISNEDTILEIPVSGEGILDSNVAVDESMQMVFDISVGATQVLRIECPKKLIGVQQ